MSDTQSIGIAYRDQAIVGGTIDNSVIGGTTPAAATFTTMECDSATVNGVPISSAGIEYLSGVTAGTATASKAVVLGASKEIATITSATISTVTTGAINANDSSLGVTGQAAGGAGIAGGAIVLTGGAGSTTGTGGALTLVGGSGGNNGLGGAVSITGGVSGGGNNAGGGIVVAGGAGTGNQAGGAISIISGAAGSGAGAAAGAISIAVGDATDGDGASLTISGGNGAGGTRAGGNLNLVPGAAVSTGVPGDLQINGVAGIVQCGWRQLLALGVPVSGESDTIFMAERPYLVKSVSGICSSSGTTPTFDIKKETGTTAPGSGTSILTGAVTLSGTANTRVTGTTAPSVATRKLAAGDRLSITWGGTVGSITGVCVEVLLTPL